MLEFPAIPPDGDLMPIKFGTDGWRAEIADAFTFANLVAQDAAS